MNNKKNAFKSNWTLFKEFVYDYQWFIVVFFWIVITILGYTGFKKYFEALGKPCSGATLFYLTLQLFVLESGSVYGDIPVELEAARILAPIIAAFSTIKVFVDVFHEKFQLFYGNFFNDHVIICGLGLKGSLLVKDFRKEGNKVVVIEKDKRNHEISTCRELGSVVIVGDATDEVKLSKAKVTKAKYLIAVCGDDGIKRRNRNESLGNG